MIAMNNRHLLFINNFYNILNECIDYIILQYVIVLLDYRSFNVQSSCRLFNQIGLMSQFRIE